MLRGIFSEDYNNHLLHRDRIRGLVVLAQEKIKGYTLYGKRIDINNPEELIACLFILNKELNAFHEPM